LNPLGRLFNAGYGLLAGGTLVPNTEEDRRGLFSTVFAAIAPIQARTRELKQTNLARYKLLKHTVNAILLILVLALLYGTFELAEAVLRALV